MHPGDALGIGVASACVLLAGFWPWTLRPAATVLLAATAFIVGLALAMRWS